MDPRLVAAELEYQKRVEAEKNHPASIKIAICQDCPSLIRITNMCRECGCLVYAKVHWPGATCPLGKW